jgi:hypothetical protein
MVGVYSIMPPRTRQTQTKPDEIGNEDVVIFPRLYCGIWEPTSSDAHAER